MIYPCELLNRLVPLMTKKSSIICMTPSPLQTEQCENKWRNYVREVKAIAASPYGEWETLEQAAEQIRTGKYPQEGLSFLAHLKGLFGQRLWFYRKTNIFAFSTQK